LTGCTPFFGDDLDEIIQKNTNATVCYEFQEIGIKVSNNGIYFKIKALDLMKKLLNICPEKRPTAEKALAHEWFLKTISSKELINVSSVKSQNQNKSTVQNNMINLKNKITPFGLKSLDATKDTN
jgi:serine/threonine protein kinase